MNGFVWCLSVIFVAIVFCLATVLAGSALIGVWFDAKNREAKKATEGALEALKSMASMAESMKNGRKSDENSAGNSDKNEEKTD
jgi:hypothetical protein